MAILYSKTKKNSPEPTQGFDITFTDGTVYNLDELVRTKGRSNQDVELFLRVIDSKEISQSILSDIMSMLKTTISQVISDKEVQTGVSNIINGVVAKYGLINLEEIPENVYKIINKEVNDYLISIFDAYGISYTVKFFDASRAEITYSISDPESLQQLVNERFNFYITKYKNELNNLEEGSLNLTNTGQRRTVGEKDYKKYLLGTEFGQEKSSQGFVPNVTGRRPIIMWEDGSQDTSDGDEDALTIYDTIKEIEDTLSEHSSILNGNGDSVLKDLSFTEMALPIGDGSENDVSRVEGFGLIRKHIIIL